jgi:hypothetical protein
MATIWDLMPASLWPVQPFIPPVDPMQPSTWPQWAPPPTNPRPPSSSSLAWPMAPAASASEVPYAETRMSAWDSAMRQALAARNDPTTRPIDEDEGLVPPRDADRALAPNPPPAPPAVMPRPFAPPPVEAPLWQRFLRVPLTAAGTATGALAGAMLLGSTTRTANPEDDEFHPQYVVRGGRSEPRPLQNNVSELTKLGLAGEHGMSSSSAPDLNVDQIAAVARYPNSEISYTILPELLALGYRLVPTGNGRNPLHASILLRPGESELTDEQAAALSALFAQHRLPNPYIMPRQ